MAILVIGFVLGQGRRCLFSHREKGKEYRGVGICFPGRVIILQPFQSADRQQPWSWEQGIQTKQATACSASDRLYSFGPLTPRCHLGHRRDCSDWRGSSHMLGFCFYFVYWLESKKRHLMYKSEIF